jgi:hypothetical protein
VQYGLRTRRHLGFCSVMTDAGIQVVQVRTDEFPRGKLELWLAAVPRRRALSSVLQVIPDGWTVRLAELHLKRAEIQALQMPVGTVRRFRD